MIPTLLVQGELEGIVHFSTEAGFSVGEVLLAVREKECCIHYRPPSPISYIWSKKIPV